MKLTHAMTLTGALFFSSFAMAEGGGDRTFERMMAASNLAVEKYVANEANRNTVASSDAKKDDAK